MNLNQRRPFFSTLRCAVAAAVFFFTIPAPAELHEGDLVAICGDSITQQKIYSLFIECYLLMCQPAPRLSTVQCGWNGETTWKFLSRVENDVLPFKPTVVTICYGMNDARANIPAQRREAQYSESLKRIIALFQKNGVRDLVIASPGVVDTFTHTKSDPLPINLSLAAISRIASSVATEKNLAFADINPLMLDAMTRTKARFGPKYHLAGTDGVHPAANGHLLMAYVILKALGCEGAIGTISVDLAAQTATSSEGHKILSMKDGVIEIESSRYPFCFFGQPTDPNATSGIIEFIPFNQDLNRFRLVVKNAKAGGMRISWGKNTKAFSAAALSEGINLAAEFPTDNPFAAPFASVQSLIAEKQAFETLAGKELLHSLLSWNKALPQEKPTTARLVAGVLQKWQELRDRASAGVSPVIHTLRLVPVSRSECLEAPYARP